jgi:cell division protein FtsB
MTQKSSGVNLVSSLLQTIDTKEITDESMRRTVEILLNLIEQQQVEIKELREENQKLRDENNRLKGIAKYNRA